MRSIFKRHERGDTIVEVLIAVAIISVVLAVAYATMSRNVMTMQDNQERSAAAKLAQSQVEALKQAWATTDGRTSISSRRSAGFCMSAGLAYATGAGTSTATAAADNLNAYAVECRSSFYSIGIRYNSSADTYTVHTRWNRVGDGRQSEIVIAYRVE